MNTCCFHNYYRKMCNKTVSPFMQISDVLDKYVQNISHTEVLQVFFKNQLKTLTWGPWLAL